MLKNSKEKTWERVSLRKETLKNRKEDFKSKVLRGSKMVTKEQKQTT
jgi:hypothetical protein